MKLDCGHRAVVMEGRVVATTSPQHHSVEGKVVRHDLNSKIVRKQYAAMDSVIADREYANVCRDTRVRLVTKAVLPVAMEQAVHKNVLSSVHTIVILCWATVDALLERRENIAS